MFGLFKNNMSLSQLPQGAQTQVQSQYPNQFNHAMNQQQAPVLKRPFFGSMFNGAGPHDHLSGIQGPRSFSALTALPDPEARALNRDHRPQQNSFDQYNSQRNGTTMRIY